MSASQSVLPPRKYQEEIFRQARESNVIAAMETGSGKTYIAVLLMRWIAVQPSAYTAKKKIVFLVPKVALALQQADYIGKHTMLRVALAHGGEERSAEERKKWADRLSKADVLVATGQAFVNLLTHSNWSLSRVSLLVFDECHHARKNHPFNIILREYFYLAESSRPKIFGMTASPTWSTRNPEGSILELERNMNAKIFTVRDHVDELIASAPKPIEEICQYDAPPEAYPSYTIPSLWALCEVGDVPIQTDIPWEKVQSRYWVAMVSLGVFGAEMCLHAELRARTTVHRSSTVEDEIESLRSRFLEGTTLDSQSSGTLNPSLAHIRDALDDYSMFFDYKYNGLDLPVPWKFSLSWCTPKVARLVELLSLHYTESMKGIIFVEQRHVAVNLARILNRVPELHGLIRAAEIVGIGDGDAPGTSMAASAQHAVLQKFRNGKLNILIATQVAEEGLDFPACDLVVRFDGIQNMVGYVQSRGRARHALSRFVIMVQGEDSLELARYRKLLEAEPEIKQIYDSQRSMPSSSEMLVDTDEEIPAADLTNRERFVVPDTGAILTYDNAIGLLDRLCALIPHDPYTEVPKPAFSEDFECTLRLPNALPLDSADLVFHGPLRHSKREARRAVAFRAVKKLHELDVFDDYLLPRRNTRRGGDIDSHPLLDTSNVPEMMDVIVRDPWTLGPVLWAHPVYVDGQLVAGLITGTMLPPVSLTCDGLVHTTSQGTRVSFDEAGEWKQRELMRRYTDNALWWCNTGRPRTRPLSCYLVPMKTAQHPDFDAMEQLLDAHLGSYEWTPIVEMHTRQLLLRNQFHFGRTYLFQKIRWDLTPSSCPTSDTREAGFLSFLEYYRAHYKRKGVIPDYIPTDGPLVEAFRFRKQTSSSIDIGFDGASTSQLPFVDEKPYLLPLRSCAWLAMPNEMFMLYRTFPQLLRRITGVYRARIARRELGLPAVEDNLLVEAFTIPSTGASFNNQRLETLGDVVLKVCTSVYLFSRYPRCHEGQLDRMRSACVRNTTLLSHAKQIGLEEFLSCEGQNVKTWPYVVQEGSPSSEGSAFDRRVSRRMPRRSLQDCMEASLGASWLSGGIDMALRTGTALGLNFGGTLPWSMRYSRIPEPAVIPPSFTDLQSKLGYDFHRPEVLMEALTHPSFSSSDPSYQRLEFLGDALIDLPLMNYLYHKFPQATSAQLANMREHAACAPVLAWIAVNKLHLHKLFFSNNAALSTEIAKYTPILRGLSCDDIVQRSWAYDPPKALSDVLESLVGAVLLDSAYDLEKTAAVVEGLLHEVLEVLTPTLDRDPVSQLMMWTAQSGCARMHFQKSMSHPCVDRFDSISVVVHNKNVGETVTASSLSIAKAFASAHALQKLRDLDSAVSLVSLCDCRAHARDGNKSTPSLGAVRVAGVLRASVAPAQPQIPLTSSSSSSKYLDDDNEFQGDTLDDSLDAGFAAIAQQKLAEVMSPPEMIFMEVKNDAGYVEDEDSGEDFIGSPDSKPGVGQLSVDVY